jgi:hypothetical protein
VRRLVRATLVLVVAVAVPVVAAPAADAVTRDRLSAYVDRAAVVWAERQDPSGEFLDPHRDRPSSGYGNALIGYGLLRAGERRGDEELVRKGVEAVDTILDEPPATRGVFDILAVAAAYNFGTASLADDPAFSAARTRWDTYLRTTGPPNEENSAQACIEALDCFHNHEAVEATAYLELIESGIEAPALGGSSALRGRVLTELGVVFPEFTGGSARIEGEREEGGLGLFSDTGSWPLSYHALSSAMLARSVALLGNEAPTATRDAERRTAATLAGFMSPDGSVSYIGRRQEVSWTLAAAIVTAQRYRPTAAARAFDRLRERYPITDRGMPIVPRSGPDQFEPNGTDGRNVAFNGLTIYLLNVAADRAPREFAAGLPLTADEDGAFVDPGQNGFAAVRRGDVWFAVRRRADPPDLRNDFGLIAAKWRSPSGDWVDIVPPRPYARERDEAAGPVIERDGERIVPRGRSISVREDGTVVTGGVRFTPEERSVRISLRARPGDALTYTVYRPEASGESYPVETDPAEEPVEVEPTFASCCYRKMVAERHQVRVPTAETVAFEVFPPARERPAPADTGEENDGGGVPWWVPPLLLIALATAVLFVRRRQVVRGES